MMAQRNPSEEAAIAAFLAAHGATRCPTAYALPTHARTDEQDRAALQRHHDAREQARRPLAWGAAASPDPAAAPPAPEPG